MKLLTLNFLTCAVKACKSSPTSFPLHTKECVLERSSITFQPAFMRNILPRISLEAMQSVCDELGLGAMLPAADELERLLERNLNADGKEQHQERDGEGMDFTTEGKPGEEEGEQQDEALLQKLHTLLLETNIDEGKLVCGNCGFEYPVKEGVGNFLLPAHLV